MATKGSKSSGSSAPKSAAPVGYIGTICVLPEKTTVGEGSYENKSQVSFADKQSGCYGRAMATKKESAGKFQWKNGKSGTRSEYKVSSTVRIGDKSGYTEVYNELRIRNVSYNKSSGGSKNLICFDYEDVDGCMYGYGGYGCDYDSDYD